MISSELSNRKEITVFKRKIEREQFRKAFVVAFMLLTTLVTGIFFLTITEPFSLLELSKKEGLKKVYVHIFTDGRDVSPTSGIKYIEALEKYMKKLGVGKIASLGGRYYGMDRDTNFDRVEKAYNAMVVGTSVKEAKKVWKESKALWSCLCSSRETLLWSWTRSIDMV